MAFYTFRETLEIIVNCKSKHDGESLEAIIEFQKEIINDAIKSRVKSISDENKNLQKAFDSMYKNCLRLLKKHEPETLKNRLNEIQELLKQ